MPENQDTRLREMARRVLDQNRYMVLGTSEADHRPRVSPVFFTHDRYRTLYWVSSPEAQHSRNLADAAEVAIVVFDSSNPPSHNNEAVYVEAHAHEVPEADLAGTTAAAFRDSVRKGARSFSPEELSGAGDLRLYAATIEGVDVHIRGSDPHLGRGLDSRYAVPLPLDT